MPFLSGCSWPHTVHFTSQLLSSTNVARFPHFGQKIRIQLLTMADMATSRVPERKPHAGPPRPGVAGDCGRPLTSGVHRVVSIVATRALSSIDRCQVRDEGFPVRRR
jgi:hypothetical protein